MQCFENFGRANAPNAAPWLRACYSVIDIWLKIPSEIKIKRVWHFSPHSVRNVLLRYFNHTLCSFYYCT